MMRSARPRQNKPKPPELIATEWTARSMVEDNAERFIMQENPGRRMVCARPAAWFSGCASARASCARRWRCGSSPAGRSPRSASSAIARHWLPVEQRYTIVQTSMIQTKLTPGKAPLPAPGACRRCSGAQRPDAGDLIRHRLLPRGLADALGERGRIILKRVVGVTSHPTRQSWRRQRGCTRQPRP